MKLRNNISFVLMFGLSVFGCAESRNELLNGCRSGDATARAVYARTMLVKELREIARKIPPSDRGISDKGFILVSEELATIDEQSLDGGLSENAIVDEGGLYDYFYVRDRRWGFSIHLHEDCSYRISWHFDPVKGKAELR